MNKKITVLIVDDEDQSKTIQALQTQLKAKCEFEAITILTTDITLRQDDSDHLDINKLKESITKAIDSRHIDYALTDFNLAESSIDGLSVVDLLSQLRPKLRIIMYSGNINAVVKRVLGKSKIQDASDDEIISAVSKLIQYPVIDYVRRDNYRDKLIEYINRNLDFSIQDYFLQQLRQHSEMRFQSCYAKLSGKSFGEIADMIENADDRTNDWIRELIEQSIAYLVKINE